MLNGDLLVLILQSLSEVREGISSLEFFFQLFKHKPVMWPGSGLEGSSASLSQPAAFSVPTRTGR